MPQLLMNSANGSGDSECSRSLVVRWEGQTSLMGLLIFPCIQNILSWPYVLNILAGQKVQVFILFQQGDVMPGAWKDSLEQRWQVYCVDGSVACSH